MYLHKLLLQKTKIESKLKCIDNLLHKSELDLDASTIFAIKSELDNLRSQYKDISKQSKFLLN